MEIQMVHPILFGKLQLFLGGVYMRKLAPARVLYRDDFLTVAGLAQSIERFTAKREVAGSIPGAGPLLRVLKWLRNEGTFFALQAARPSRGSDDHVKWQSRLH